MADQPNQPWCTPDDVRAFPAYEKLVDEDDTLLTMLCDVASAWLWRATGRQYAGLSGATVVRPVPRCTVNFRSVVGGWSRADSFDSRTGTFGYGGYGARGEGAFEVGLGFYPVRGVSEVVVDGAVLASANYRVDDERTLVRTDGHQWPGRQDWAQSSAAGGAVGTWQVTLTWGADPPADAVHAAKILTGELALSNTNADASRLNPRIQSVARQGTQMLMMDPMMLIQGESWGIRECDLLVAALNPYKVPFGTAVLSPDIPRAIRQVGT